MISIAMATYNGAQYIKEQLDSILNQTYQDFELIICDDCSSDLTYGILQDYAAKDQRIHIYKNEKNLGFKKNFEKAVSLCNGDYIAFSDQDDVWMKNHLELLSKNIRNKSLVCGDSILINKDGQLLGMTLKYQESLDYIPQNDIDKSLSIFLFRNPYQGASMMINRKLCTIAFPIPESVNYHDTWLASVACYVDGINYIEKPLLKYRRLPSSITGLRYTRRSKWKSFLHDGIYNDRIYIINGILENKKISLAKKDKNLLEKVRKMCIRDKKLTGRLYNNIIKLLHYKVIYSCDKRHWT